jgi:biofilm PGA synthesis protein PgaD
LASTGDKVLIDSPQLLSRRHRVVDTLATGFIWLVYSYLWAPMISLVAWLLGFEFAYDVMVRAGGFETLKELIGFYSFVVACLFVVVAGWSTINRRRFSGHDRRQTIDPVPDAEIAAYFGIEDKQLAALRESRISQISVDEEGLIVSVEARMLEMNEESAPSIGPEGAVADNETDYDKDENETLIQGPV